MEENTNKPNQSNKKPGKKPYYKKRYTPQPQKRKFWNADKIVGLSAMSIALFTLVVLIYQSRILNQQYELTVKQQKASVLPYLQISNSTGSTYYKIFLENKGLGPAFIEGMYAKEKDSIFSIPDLYNYYHFRANNESDSLISDYYSSISKGVVLTPGESIELYVSNGTKSGIAPVSRFYSKYFGTDDSFKFMIKYHSVFDDYWIAESTLKNISDQDYGDFEVFYDWVE